MELLAGRLGELQARVMALETIGERIGELTGTRRESGRKAFHEDCTLCGRCAEYCPDDEVIQIRFFGIKLFSSARAYYKRRVKQESPEGMPKQKVIWLRAEKADGKLV